jgi:hypothetical protein
MLDCTVSSGSISSRGEADVVQGFDKARPCPPSHACYLRCDICPRTDREDLHACLQSKRLTMANAPLQALYMFAVYLARISLLCEIDPYPFTTNLLNVWA